MQSKEELTRLAEMSMLEREKAKELKEKERRDIQELKYNYVGKGFHSGAITEMHTCLQRPILLTCSIPDQTVRIWNYITNTCELTENFADINIGLKPLSAAALHPSGYYMAVALVD